MAAAEYYGSHPDYSGDDGRRRGNNSPLSPHDDIDERPGGGPQHTLTGTSAGSTATTPYPHSPYAPTSDEDLSYQAYGDSSSSQYGYPTDTSYKPPQRESTTSVATQSKQYSDPYAENIPLNTRRPSMPSPNDSSSSIPPAERPVKHHTSHPSHKHTRRRPWFCWILAVIQVGVFIAEIGRNASLTGSPIAIKPSFNPMIGPSAYVQINMGGRYVLCMQYQKDLWEIDGEPVTGEVLFPCPWTTKADAECTLAQHCGFSGVPTQEEMMRDHVGPNQWYRFIIPMFLHAGLIHIGFNMLLQLRLGADMEREIGPLRFAIVYFASGIFGFILGGNFAPRGVVSTGASGCLFGVLALVLLDLLYTWNERRRPGVDLAWLMVDIVISFLLGLLPGLDNFAHIGGFLMGLMLGLTILHSPTILRKRIGEPTSYSAMMSGGSGPGHSTKFFKDPVGFFKGRKGMWWVWWGVRAGTLAAAVVATIVLLRGFYVSRVECGWCKYLSCLPVSNWCEIGELQMHSTNSTGG